MSPSDAVSAAPSIDLVCLSHLRWDFVFQRPQHLMMRFARNRRVFFVEEPILDAVDRDLAAVAVHGGVMVMTPHLRAHLHTSQVENRQRLLLDRLLREHEVNDFILWYYTPMAMGYSAHLRPRTVVWDCMDELRAFANAPAELGTRERLLLRRADLVFTGGHSLYEAKRRLHDRVFAFPSSVEMEHFAQARRRQGDPPDQSRIPHPRIGFHGVLDERLDIELLRSCARTRPDWHWVLIGPVVKIDPHSLPRLPNIHYLGKKDYRDLPAYLAGWDAAMLPFARNEATRFISPTKTPEYLAAGRPVVSTAIRDVVRPYGAAGLVRIANAPDAFIAGLERAIAEGPDRGRLARVDDFLAGDSWDRTCAAMQELIARTIASPPARGRAATGRQRGRA